MALQTSQLLYRRSAKMTAPATSMPWPISVALCEMTSMSPPKHRRALGIARAGLPPLIVPQIKVRDTSQMQRKADVPASTRADRRARVARNVCSVLPSSLPPRGLSREQAASYVGVGTTTFDQMVKDRLMPRTKEIKSRRVWDRSQLDRAFDMLPGGDGNGDDGNDIWSRAEV